MFWDNVLIGTADECWPWCGPVNKKGYGILYKNYKELKAHRFAVNAVGGVVMHACDFPACCNPGHLIIGTQEQNLKDMRNKGRQNYSGLMRSVGIKKFSDEKIAEIKTAFLSVPKGPAGKTSNGYMRELASKFGVSYWYISKICRGSVRGGTKPVKTVRKPA